MSARPTRLSRADAKAADGLPVRTRHSPHFSAAFTPHSSPKLTCVVSKKVVRTAVLRNRLKRRMRAAAQEAVLPGAIIFLRAKAGAGALPFSSIRDEVVGLLGFQGSR